MGLLTEGGSGRGGVLRRLLGLRRGEVDGSGCRSLQVKGLHESRRRKRRQEVVISK